MSKHKLDTDVDDLADRLLGIQNRVETVNQGTQTDPCQRTENLIADLRKTVDHQQRNMLEKFAKTKEQNLLQILLLEELKDFYE